MSDEYSEKVIKHLDMVLISDRIKSFSTWPVQLIQNKNILSECGFFYTGKSDRTICFYCGLGCKV